MTDMAGLQPFMPLDPRPYFPRPIDDRPKWYPLALGQSSIASASAAGVHTSSISMAAQSTGCFSQPLSGISSLASQTK